LVWFGLVGLVGWIEILSTHTHENETTTNDEMTTDDDFLIQDVSGRNDFWIWEQFKTKLMDKKSGQEKSVREC